MSSQAAITLAYNKKRAAQDHAAELEAEYEGLPKTAAEYMKPPMKEKESTIVLPHITAHLFELRSPFLHFLLQALRSWEGFSRSASSSAALAWKVSALSLAKVMAA